MRAICTTRHGGSSDLPYKSMNLGDHVGDAPECVQANRLALRLCMGAQAVFLKQVHGTQVLALEAGTADGQAADASVTSQPGLACTVMVADCLPVLLAHEEVRVVGAAHVGWRGLVGAAGGGGVIDAIFKSFSALAHMDRSKVAPKTIAWLGPCIGPAAFEVGAEVKDALLAGQPDASAMFVPLGHGGGKYLANLPGLARLHLRALGITKIYGNDASLAWCTVANPSRFFSHRRDAGFDSSLSNGCSTTGRMAAGVWLV